MSFFDCLHVNGCDDLLTLLQVTLPDFPPSSRSCQSKHVDPPNRGRCIIFGGLRLGRLPSSDWFAFQQLIKPISTSLSMSRGNPSPTSFTSRCFTIRSNAKFCDLSSSYLDPFVRYTTVFLFFSKQILLFFYNTIKDRFICRVVFKDRRFIFEVISRSGFILGLGWKLQSPTGMAIDLVTTSLQTPSRKASSGHTL